MKYNLEERNQRKKFVKVANNLLKNKRHCVELIDRSNSTPKQNDYIHVLFRIMAHETGVTEEYAKSVYFKDFANHDIFYTVSKDMLTGNMVKRIRSSAELSIEEMRHAIRNYIKWAADNGYYLPEATIGDDSKVEFSSENDRLAFEKADIETSVDPGFM